MLVVGYTDGARTFARLDSSSIQGSISTKPLLRRRVESEVENFVALGESEVEVKRSGRG